MRKTWQVLGLIGLTLTTGAGCAATTSASDVYWARSYDRARYQNTNSGQTPADRLHTVRRVVDQDARSMVDDIDFIMMWDRPSRLSRWHNR